MIGQNVTISQLSLKLTTSMSPILLVPMMSLSISSYFRFNKIFVSYSFSSFLNGKDFSLLLFENSKFSYFLDNVLRVESETLPTQGPTNCPIIPGQQQILTTDIKIILCDYYNVQNSSIYSTNNNLRIFSSNFTLCSAKNYGGGVYHTDGFFKTNSNIFHICSADKGGGFYHRNGPINIFRCSFNSNFGDEGCHFFVDDFPESELYIDFSFFQLAPSLRTKHLLFAKRPTNSVEPKVQITPAFCRFNFTQDQLKAYVICDSMDLLLNEDSNKFIDKNVFPGTIYPMNKESSATFKPTPLFSPTQVFTETSDFTISHVFTISSIFTNSFAFTPSKPFDATPSFTPTVHFSSSSVFTKTGNFTCSDIFTISSKFTRSSDFTLSSTFSPSSNFTSTIEFSKSLEFSPSQTGTPSYSPIPRKSPSKSPTPSTPFTFSSHFTPSNIFTASSYFTPGNSFPFSPSEEFTPISAALQATKKPLKAHSIMIVLIVLGGLLLLLGLIANIILCVEMVQAGEIIITQQM
ncbi:hypothetical protein M9Y10_016351 [Tritrichomonas musculus]|uniref:Uncharacterized protein n=1 Tax=Tritrichomonas musculus TaxID=1915356 RepID=A0ABR2HWS3_9EUKA